MNTQGSDWEAPVLDLPRPTIIRTKDDFLYWMSQVKSFAAHKSLSVQTQDIPGYYPFQLRAMTGDRRVSITAVSQALARELAAIRPSEEDVPNG